MFSAFSFISSAFSATLPSGYTELEYIESTGTQCIDTGYKWITDITEVELEFYLTYLQWGSLYGSESAAPFSYGQNLYEVDNLLYFMVGNTQFLAPFSQIIGVWEQYNAKTTSSTQGIVTYNGNQTAIIYSGGVSKVYSMAVLCSYRQGAYAQFAKARIRKFKMKDNNVLVRDLIPAKRNSDNEIGLYDKVSNTFFTNVGTGTFIAGPVFDTCTYTMMLGTSVCLSETKPTGSYLPIRYNNNKYYLNLSVESDETNPKPITSESNNALRIITNTATYNAHDASVSE